MRGEGTIGTAGKRLAQEPQQLEGKVVKTDAEDERLCIKIGVVENRKEKRQGLEPSDQCHAAQYHPPVA